MPAAVLVQGDKVREIVRGCTKADDEKLRCVRTARSAYCDIMWLVWCNNGCILTTKWSSKMLTFIIRYCYRERKHCKNQDRYTVCVNRFALRKRNRGRIGLPKVVQPTGPSIQFLVCNPIYSHSTETSSTNFDSIVVSYGNVILSCHNILLSKYPIA